MEELLNIVTAQVLSLAGVAKRADDSNITIIRVEYEWDMHANTHEMTVLMEHESWMKLQSECQLKYTVEYLSENDKDKSEHDQILQYTFIHQGIKYYCLLYGWEVRKYDLEFPSEES